MVKQHVWVYVEGGSTGKAADNDFRRGWKKFMSELHDLARLHGYDTLKIVRGESRSNAFRRFARHLAAHPEDLCVLVVDAEGPVQDEQSVWDVVAARKGDGWEKPEGADERSLYLMAQFVETWLLTDQAALARYFGRGFAPTRLPTTRLEQRSKSEIEAALKAATENTAKGAYRHGYAHEIIELVQPSCVKQLYHGKRLFEKLTELIEAQPRRRR